MDKSRDHSCAGGYEGHFDGNVSRGGAMSFGTGMDRSIGGRGSSFTSDVGGKPDWRGLHNTAQAVESEDKKFSNPWSDLLGKNTFQPISEEVRNTFQSPVMEEGHTYAEEVRRRNVDEGLSKWQRSEELAIAGGGSECNTFEWHERNAGGFGNRRTGFVDRGMCCVDRSPSYGHNTTSTYVTEDDAFLPNSTAYTPSSRPSRIPDLKHFDFSTPRASFPFPKSTQGTFLTQPSPIGHQRTSASAEETKRNHFENNSAMDFGTTTQRGGRPAPHPYQQHPTDTSPSLTKPPPQRNLADDLLHVPPHLRRQYLEMFYAMERLKMPGTSTPASASTGVFSGAAVNIAGANTAMLPRYYQMGGGGGGLNAGNPTPDVFPPQLNPYMLRHVQPMFGVGRPNEMVYDMNQQLLGVPPFMPLFKTFRLLILLMT